MSREGIRAMIDLVKPPRSRIGRSVLALLIGGLSLSLLPEIAQGQTCGFPAGGVLTGVVNTTYSGVGTAAAGAKSITVDLASRQGAPAIGNGNMVLVIQMQDAQINSTNSIAYGDGATGHGQTALGNSGLFEYVFTTSAVNGAGVFTFVGAGVGNGLVNTYTSAAATAARGKRTFQVVRVPQYGSATLSSTLTASAWNGGNGGILAIDVSGTLTLGGTVSLDGFGYQGAIGRALNGSGAGLANTDYRTSSTIAANGMKGEGIAGTPDIGFAIGADGYPNGDMARGGPGNAGGGGTDGDPNAANDQNTGGGGGANGGDGGHGGDAWPGTNNCPPDQGSRSGGLGGKAFTPSVTRLTMGGGGGAGSMNNAGPSSGAPGGGIVIIRAGQVAGAGTITARGLRPLSTANDGGGGGGGGGSIVVLSAQGTLAGLTVDASGGGGGYANLPSPPAPDPPPNTAGCHHGPGGGGGGGVIILAAVPASSSVAGGVSGLTNTCAGDSVAIPYGATAGNVGVLQTNITLGQLPGVQACTLVTRATVRGLRVNPSGLVEFATGTQHGTLAFNLWGIDDPQGRGARVRLNDRPILAPLPTSLTPILYRAETRPITTRYLVIEEIEVGGHSRPMGPFPISDEGLLKAFERVEARIRTEHVHERDGAQILTGRNHLPQRRPVLNEPPRGFSDNGVKIEVSAAGPVRVPLADLVAQGMPPRFVETPEKLHLTNLGRPVKFQVSNEGGRALVFQAESFGTDYTGRNVYVVSWQAGLPPAPAVAFTRSGFPTVPGMVRVEQNLLYAPFVAEGADPWIWDLLVSGQGATSYAFDVPNLRPGSEPIAVRIGVVGGSNHHHTVEAAINGSPVGSLTFEGKAPATLSGQLPAGDLHASGNELTLTYTADTSGPDDVGVLFFDIVDLGVQVSPPTNWVSVDRLVPYHPTLPEGGGDYLILTHSLFNDQAHAIAKLKAAEGHGAFVVDVERAYDLFSSGVFEATAIQAAIRHFGRQGHLAYVLLIGDDTFDPRNFSETGQISYLPSLSGYDGAFGRIPTENLYADLNGDGIPDLAIGRLPVQTPQQADTLVDKISRQQAVLHQAGSHHLFAVDSPGPEDVSFRGEAQKVIDMLPGAVVTVADVNLGIDEARARLLQGLGQGELATHYFGHGGFDVWSDASLLTEGDISQLPQNGRESLLFTWTCETQWYLFHQGGPSINVDLLLVPRGGALAAVGPAGITDPRLQGALYERFYTHFLEGVSLGEALRRAKTEALRADPGTKPVVEGWNLLGDPSLRLDMPRVRR